MVSLTLSPPGGPSPSLKTHYERFPSCCSFSPGGGVTMIGRVPQLSVWVLVGVLHASPAVAQAPLAPPAFPSFHAMPTSRTLAQQPSTRLYSGRDSAETSKRTYWLEGGVIGAVVLGVASFLVYDGFANSACSDTGGSGCKEYQALATVGGAGLGFLIGSLIGKGHTKAEPAAGSAPN